MRRWRRQDQRDVKIIARQPPRFYARLQVHFLFLPRPGFLLFPALNLPPTFIFVNSIYHWLRVAFAF